MIEPEPRPSEDENHTPAPLWLRRVVWAGWGLLEVFLLQNAWASRQEHEPRAALLLALLFVVLLLGAGIVRFIRRVGLLE